jgi:predicted Zn-dependent protease
LHERIKSEDSDEKKKEEPNLEGDWISDFFASDFQSARTRLKEGLANKTGDDRHRDEVWLCYTGLKLNYKGAVEDLCMFTETHKGNHAIEELVVNMLCWDDLHCKAIEVATGLYTASDNSNDSAIILANCYQESGETAKAIAVLASHKPEENPEIAISLADLHETSVDKLCILREAYENHRNNERLVYKFARELQEQHKNKEALYLIDFLTLNYSKNAEYWGYLSNVCVDLNLYEKAAPIKQGNTLMRMVGAPSRREC